VKVAVEFNLATKHSEVLEVLISPKRSEHPREVTRRRDRRTDTLAQRLAGGRAAEVVVPPGAGGLGDDPQFAAAEARPEGTVIWEDRRKPLSGPALHRWWYRCLTRAGVVDEGTTHGKKMHDARYTSGTEFYLATGDIYATQQLLGHADVSTTAKIYVQGSAADLEDKLRKVYGD
jgi:hypothetical protein